jgi:hypothetical protein
VDRTTKGRALALAAGQHGAVSVQQLTQLGITRSQRRTIVEQQVLEPLLPRVLGVVGAPDTLERRQQAGLLCLGPDAVLSHDPAARFHRFDRTPPNVVDTLKRSGRGSRAALRVHTTARLPPIDRVRVDGWPCTSATRTVIDLARGRVGDRRLEAAIDSAVRDGLSSPTVIAHRLGELRGPDRWGARRLDALLLDAGGHTFLERRFLELVRRGGSRDRGRNSSTGAMAARSPGSTSASRTTDSSSRCPAARATAHPATGPVTRRAATSCRTPVARSTSSPTST